MSTKPNNWPLRESWARPDLGDFVFLVGLFLALYSQLIRFGLVGFTS